MDGYIPYFFVVSTTVPPPLSDWLNSEYCRNKTVEKLLKDRLTLTRGRKKMIASTSATHVRFHSFYSRSITVDDLLGVVAPCSSAWA